jgi:hypothetical protein
MFELFVVDFTDSVLCGELLYSTHGNILDIKSNHSQVLWIDCEPPMTAELTTESIIPSDQQQSSPHKTESVKSTTKSSNIDAASTAPTTDNSTNVKLQH